MTYLKCNHNILSLIIQSAAKVVLCPTSALMQFACVADSNTKRGLETYGLLCGRKVKKCFFRMHFNVNVSKVTKYRIQFNICIEELKLIIQSKALC